MGTAMTLTPLVVLGALVLGLALPAPPVAAQAAGGPPPTTVPPVEDPGAGGDAPTPSPLDPDEIPDPPDEGGGVEDEGDIDHELIVGSVELAEARLADLERELAAAIGQVTDLEARLKIFDKFETDFTAARNETVAALARARARRLDRAIGAYIRGGPLGLEARLLAGPDREAEESELLSSVLEADGDEVTRLLAERLDLTARLSRVSEERATARVQLAFSRRAVELGREAVVSGAYAARIFAAGSEVAITGFVFPVGDPHDFIDSWGFARAGGRHEGADIFAERGTPLFATEDGVLVRVGRNRLGGIKLWLVGESGTHYYYAHLDGYAVGVSEGVVVNAGDVIGYVGNTGDAQGTSPHLHFELHPNGGAPVNPFPLLQVVDQPKGAGGNA